MKKICILGATGSVGTQTLDVVSRQSDKFAVCGLTANSNINLLEQQIRKFKPLKAAIADRALFTTLRNNLKDCFTEILCGEDGVIEVASMNESDIVVSSIVGVAGLKPTLAAIDAKKDIALANKETMVTAGRLVCEKAKENNVKILPVDSEHSAIFQCLMSGGKPENISRIILTCSGGPFFGKDINFLKNVKPEDALKHPNWSMGQKITIDSATLMNKGLEFIEAKWLFDVPTDKIDIVVHRQSVIHSMVEYADGAIIAQLGEPDMRVPISVAMNYPEREIIKDYKPFDFIMNSNLTFEVPDEDTFKCLKLAKNAIKTGGTQPAYLNGANEMAVELFLKKKISFTDIGDIIEESLKKNNVIDDYNLNDVFNADKSARENVLNIYGGKL